MTNYQFYSIMFALWFIIAMLASSKILIGVAFLLSFGYGVASIYQSFKEEEK